VNLANPYYLEVRLQTSAAFFRRRGFTPGLWYPIVYSVKTPPEHQKPAGTSLVSQRGQRT